MIIFVSLKFLYCIFYIKLSQVNNIIMVFKYFLIFKKNEKYEKLFNSNLFNYYV